MAARLPQVDLQSEDLTRHYSRHSCLPSGSRTSLRVFESLLFVICHVRVSKIRKSKLPPKAQVICTLCRPAKGRFCQCSAFIKELAHPGSQRLAASKYLMCIETRSPVPPLEKSTSTVLSTGYLSSALSHRGRTDHQLCAAHGALRACFSFECCASGSAEN